MSYRPVPQVHGPCDTISTAFRPVPLTWQYCHAVDGYVRLVPMVDPKRKGQVSTTHLLSLLYHHDHMAAQKRLGTPPSGL